MSEKEVRKIFSSKKALLEYLGKNGKDTKLIDRMIGKGEVRRLEDGGYELVQNMSGEEAAALREKIAEQEKRIAELEEENRKLRERLEERACDTREPIQEKMESGKPNMDKLREIAAGKFLSEPKEEKQQFVKGGDKREWN